MNWRLPNGRSHCGEKVRGLDKIESIAYADDIVLMSDEKHLLQSSLQTHSDVMASWGLTINTDKTKTQVIQPQNTSEYITLSLYSRIKTLSSTLARLR